MSQQTKGLASKFKRAIEVAEAEKARAAARAERAALARDELFADLAELAHELEIVKTRKVEDGLRLEHGDRAVTLRGGDDLGMVRAEWEGGGLSLVWDVDAELWTGRGEGVFDFERAVEEILVGGLGLPRPEGAAPSASAQPPPAPSPRPSVAPAAGDGAKPGGPAAARGDTKASTPGSQVRDLGDWP